MGLLFDGKALQAASRPTYLVSGPKGQWERPRGGKLARRNFLGWETGKSNFCAMM